MVKWGGQIDQAAGLRRLFGVDVAPTLAFSSGDADLPRAGLMLNTARSLAAAGHRVVLIDERRGLDSLATKLRLRPKHDLFDVVAGDVFASEAMIAVAPRVHLLAAARAAHEFERGEVGLAERIGAILREIRLETSYVLIDCATHRGGLSQLAAAAEHLVIHTSPQSAAITQSYAFLKRVGQEQGRSAMLVTVTQSRRPADARAVFDNMRDTARRHLGLALDYLDAAGNATTGKGKDDVGLAIANTFQRAVESWDTPAYTPQRRTSAAMGMI